MMCSFSSGGVKWEVVDTENANLRVRTPPLFLSIEVIEPSVDVVDGLFASTMELVSMITEVRGLFETVLTLCCCEVRALGRIF